MARHSENNGGFSKYIIIVLLIIIIIGGIYLFKDKFKTVQTNSNTNNSLSDSTVKSNVSSLTITIEDFKNKLVEEGLKIDKETPKAANLIGAKEGYGYEINGTAIEIYLFDEKSTDSATISNIKSAKENGTVIMPSFNNMKLNIKYNKGLGLVKYENHPDKNKILEIFNNL